MFQPDESSNDDSATPTLRVVAIIAKNEVVELWYLHLRRTDYRERDIEVGKDMRVRLVDGRRQRREVRARGRQSAGGGRRRPAHSRVRRRHASW